MTLTAVLVLALHALVAWCVTLTRALHRVERALAVEADRLRLLEVQDRRTRHSAASR